MPPEQVHLSFEVEDFPAEVLLRFKGPQVIGFMIEELARYRKIVWPDAPPIDLSNLDLDEQPEEEG